MGNVGRDPQIRYVEGRQVASLSLATTDRAYTTRDGVSIPERTEWHELVLWDRAAETAEKYIRRGTRLYVEGKLRTRSWQDRNAITRKVTEIVVDTFEIVSRPTTQQSNNNSNLNTTQ